MTGGVGIHTEERSVWETWGPVTYDHGLIRASVEEIAPVRTEMYREHALRVDCRHLDGPLEEIFGALPPLSSAPTKELFIATDFGWTVFLQNGVAGSDPALAMRQLSRRMGVTAMRVCIAGADRPYPGVMWEVYEPPASGGDARGGRRAIAAANDGGSWVFHNTGAPYDFEDVSRYSARRKRDRFTREMLSAYLRRFGVPPLGDERLLADGGARAAMIARPPHAHLPQFSLQEVAAGKPWGRE